jgi:hypothetical protein
MSTMNQLLSSCARKKKLKQNRTPSQRKREVLT